MIIDELVEIYEASQGKKIDAVASGPDGMRRLVRKTRARLVRDGLNIDVTIERGLGGKFGSETVFIVVEDL